MTLINHPMAGRPRHQTKDAFTASEVPPEVYERFGEFPVHPNGDYLYGFVPKHRLPRWIKTKYVSVSKLVWMCHYPNHRFFPREKLMYRDGNSKNNKIGNLFLGGL